MRVYPIDEAASLTARQVTIVHLLSKGQSMKQVAYELGISLRTVENHVTAARQAAGAQNVTALVATALRNGWVT